MRRGSSTVVCPVGAAVVDGLRDVLAGPWWPPLDDLVAAARTFLPGAVAGEVPARLRG